MAGHGAVGDGGGPWPHLGLTYYILSLPSAPGEIFTLATPCLSLL